MKKIIIALVAVTTMFCSCDKNTNTTTPGTNNNGNNNGNNNPNPTNPTSYEQYLTCKVDGTTYTAYYAPDHTTKIVCALNIKSQTIFETDADEIKEGGETLLSNLSFTLYGFQAKEAGVYTCPEDLYLDGTLERMVNGKKERINYVISHGQSFTVSSYKNGIMEGTFSAEVQDENNPVKRYMITEGKFKVKVP